MNLAAANDAACELWVLSSAEASSMMNIHRPANERKRHSALDGLEPRRRMYEDVKI